MAITELSHNLYSNAITDGKLGDMAAQVALQNFDLRYATLLFFNSTLHYGVEVFLRIYHYNVMVNIGTFSPRIASKTHQFVLFASDVADIEQIVEIIIDFEVDNTGKFIIICESSMHNDCDEQDIMELCWNNRIVNVVFIRSNTTEAVGFTYYPVAEGICYNLKPIKLDCCNKYSNTIYGGIFRDKLRDLNLCPLTVSTFIQTPYIINITNGTPIGADGDLLRLLILGLNCTLKMMTPNRGQGWGWRQNNGTWMGSLADVHDELANISMTSAALTLTRFSDFQISDAYYASKIVWITHPAQSQNVALKLLHPFESDTRVALVVSFLLIVLYAFVIKTRAYMCSEAEGNQPTKSIVFYAWMICMGQAVIKMPTRSAFLQMALMWVWYCFLIRTAYQVYLIGSLKGKFYEDQFESIEDVINAKYPFGGGPALKDYYIDNPIVYNNWINVDTPQMRPTIMNISKGMNFVLAMNMDTAMIFIKNNKVSLHILPQTIASSPTVVFFKKYSPLLESVNLILGRLSASGFTDKLHKIYTSISTTMDKTSDEEETMKIRHFTACYIILITGWILSALFFSLEIYFGKIYKHPVEA